MLGFNSTSSNFAFDVLHNFELRKIFILFILFLNGLFLEGLTPGVTGSIATGATYFVSLSRPECGLKNHIQTLGDLRSHFIAGAVGRFN